MMQDYDFKLFDYEPRIELNKTIESPRKIKINEKVIAKSFLKKEKSNEILTDLPLENECICIVSNGGFDYFNFIPISINLIGGICEDFYFTTWTMNKINVGELFNLFDNGKIKKINALIGLYFKKREQAVFNLLFEGIKDRGQRIFCNENHSKVTLIEGGGIFWLFRGAQILLQTLELNNLQYTTTNAFLTFIKNG